jgi:ABC-2 type transport system permease protein
VNGWRTLLPNAWYVAVREFRSRVRTRTFVMATALLAAVGLAAGLAPVLIDVAMSTNQTHLAVVERAPNLPADSRRLIEAQLNPSNAAGTKPFAVTWLSGDDLAAAQSKLEKGEYGALLVVDRDPRTGNLAFTLRTDMIADGPTTRSIVAAAMVLSVDDVAARAGTSFTAVLQTPFDIQPATPGAKPRDVSGEISSTLVSTALIVLIFMAIITYGTWVAMSVAEEKGSRVMELMLNAATPLQMLAGKVAGNGAAGLFQYGFITGAVVVGLLAQNSVRERLIGTSSGGLGLGGLSPEVFGAFLVLFIGGFLLYALLYAALGSLVSRQEDVQAATSPLMMLIMAGYFLSVFGIQAIDETWVKVLSFVPFFSPYLMLARVAVGHVEPWELGLAVLLIAVSIVAALFVAARIYSAGVLLYGQRAGLRQVLKAARVAR